MHVSRVQRVFPIWTQLLKMKVEKEGLFDVSVNKMLDVEQLQPETVFQCLLRIPGTQFSVREETMYFPGKGNLTNE